ncbi:DUF134 domain-containing protein [Methanobacterium sp.]|uniref:DUF134 domain-containing protein n=1 Tax=Methanobacterium sp. TaxID=2164 RepID=UPI003C72F879
MPRPRVFRKISKEPEIRCFKPEKENLEFIEPIEITIDELEAIRLRDYHDVHQKKSAEIMGISQSTFHRILTSARKKIAKALIEGNTIVIVGGDYIIDKKMYKCNVCGFEWSNPKKEYDKCLECESEEIDIVTENAELPLETEPSLLERRSYGGPGMGFGPPKVCKCPNCGYESPKTRAVPCKNTLCPECGTPLCGGN